MRTFGVRFEKPRGLLFHGEQPAEWDVDEAGAGDQPKLILAQPPALAVLDGRDDVALVRADQRDG
ncbi:hypothetical protein [Microlunatus parietis]|uniref:Uncharacterized protein n=1 Tax=Microlunatus parietis TaxID=682979 RepID=A0A7Y9I6H8_9ACTN|nr:hypothetical protein [Microlunatus parietis]NYE71182.1 hypothetical protein [Microlunatus parietis]